MFATAGLTPFLTIPYGLLLRSGIAAAQKYAGKVAAGALRGALTTTGVTALGLGAGALTARAISSLVRGQNVSFPEEPSSLPGRVFGAHRLGVVRQGEQLPLELSDPEIYATIVPVLNELAKRQGGAAYYDADASLRPDMVGDTMNWAGLAAAGIQAAQAAGLLNQQQAQVAGAVASAALGAPASVPQNAPSSTPATLQQSGQAATVGQLISAAVPIVTTVLARPTQPAAQPPIAPTSVQQGMAAGAAAARHLSQLRQIVSTGDALAVIGREYPDVAWALRYARYRVNGGAALTVRDAVEPVRERAPACRGCSGGRPWRRPLADGGPPAGVFFRSPLVTAAFVRNSYSRQGIHGEINLAGKPFAIRIASDQTDPRAIYALSHELVHLADFMLKLGLSHDTTHALGLFLVDTWFPVIRAALPLVGRSAA